MAIEAFESIPVIFAYGDEDRATLLGNTDFKEKKETVERILDPFTQNRSTEEILKLQCQFLKEIIGDELILPKVDSPKHHRQENSDYLITCVVASARTISDSLTDLELHSATQEHLMIKQMVMASDEKDLYKVADASGYLPPSAAENALKASGMTVEACGCSIINLSFGLMDGKVAIFIQDKHCRVISGMRKNIGKDIEYIIHDPMSSEVIYKTIDQLYDLIAKNPLEVYISLIDDPKPTEAPIVITVPGE